MQKRRLFDSKLLAVTINRLCHQLIEVHADFANTILIGLQPRGIYFADRIKGKLQDLIGKEVPLGYLDITFHRDDFRRREEPIKPSETRIPFQIEGQNVVLIDDVLFTGRTIRAALDAMNTFGRPAKVELLVLIDRLYSRHLPIKPDYVGRKVSAVHSQRVLVELKDQGLSDNIWLTTIEDEPTAK